MDRVSVHMYATSNASIPRRSIAKNCAAEKLDDWVKTKQIDVNELINPMPHPSFQIMVLSKLNSATVFMVFC